MNYSQDYIDDGFIDRVADIYAPKLKFLRGCIKEKEVSILDVGCGGGHFVYAGVEAGVGILGVDVSESLVRFGNTQISHHLGVKPLSSADETGFYEKIKNSAASVVSAIGVIEHLREPHKFFQAFQESSSEYVFYSVPMFSNSVYFEAMSQDVFPRQLSGGHTHLFVEESIKKMNSIMGVQPIGEWRFGTDIMDLYRAMITRLGGVAVSERFIGLFDEHFKQSIDGLQSVFDNNHFCSEIHMVARKIA